MTLQYVTLSVIVATAACTSSPTSISSPTPTGRSSRPPSPSVGAFGRQVGDVLVLRFGRNLVQGVTFDDIAMAHGGKLPTDGPAVYSQPVAAWEIIQIGRVAFAVSRQCQLAMFDAATGRIEKEVVVSLSHVGAPKTATAMGCRRIAAAPMSGDAYLAGRFVPAGHRQSTGWIARFDRNLTLKQHVTFPGVVVQSLWTESDAAIATLSDGRVVNANTGAEVTIAGYRPSSDALDAIRDRLGRPWVLIAGGNPHVLGPHRTSLQPDSSPTQLVGTATHVVVITRARRSLLFVDIITGKALEQTLPCYPTNAVVRDKKLFVLCPGDNTIVGIDLSLQPLRVVSAEMSDMPVLIG